MNLRKFAALVLGAPLLLSQIAVLIYATTTYTGQTIQPVSGTFWQATQPVSGTFWQATQPVSGTFYQATQPVSGTITQGTGGASAWKVDGSAVTQPVSQVTSSGGTVTKFTCTTTSAQIIASDATRKGLECDTDATNSDLIYLLPNSGTATTSHKILGVGASWSPAGVVNLTSALQCLSASGSQVIRCTAY